MEKTRPAGALREIEFSNRQLAALIGPLLLEQLLSITVGLADSLMVATVGDAAISAVSLVDSVSALMIYIFSAMATGGAVVAGQYIGRRETDDARRAGQQMLFLVGASSLVITALMYLLRTWVLTHLFGQIEPDVMAATNTYYSIVAASVPGIALYNGGAALMRTMGRSDITLKVSLLMNGINIGGNALLIFGFGMDVAGVAIPTTLSRTVAAAVILVLLCSERYPLNLTGLRAFRLDRRLMRNIFRIAVPSGVENGMFQLGKVVLYSLISTFGTAAITANAIGNTLGNLHCFAGMAVNMGLTTVISQCVGAGDYDKARYYLKKLMLASYAMMAAINLALIAALPQIMGIYQVTPEASALAVKVVLIHGISAIFLWIPSFQTAAFLRATGDAQFTMYVSMGSMWCCRVLFAYILGKYMDYGVVGVWFSHAVLDWIVRSIIFYARYRSGKWMCMGVRD